MVGGFGEHLKVVGRREQSPWPALLDRIAKVPRVRKRACAQAAGVGTRLRPSLALGVMREP